MTQGIRQAIGELQSQLKYHQDTALKLSRAIENLRDLSAIETDSPRPTTKVKRKAASTKPAPKAKAAKAPGGKRGRGKATLAQALMHVMEAHRKAKKRGVTAKQLMSDIVASGFHFGGSSPENNMNYLYKTLRRHKAFKRVGDGLFGLA
jgi:hypothetical protein